MHVSVRVPRLCLFVDVRVPGSVMHSPITTLLWFIDASRNSKQTRAAAHDVCPVKGRLACFDLLTCGMASRQAELYRLKG